MSDASRVVERIEQFKTHVAQIFRLRDRGKRLDENLLRSFSVTSVKFPDSTWQEPFKKQHEQDLATRQALRENEKATLAFTQAIGKSLSEELIAAREDATGVLKLTHLLDTGAFDQAEAVWPDIAATLEQIAIRRRITTEQRQAHGASEVDATPLVPTAATSGDQARQHTLPGAVRNWLTRQYLADPTPGHFTNDAGANIGPIVFVQFEAFADFLIGAGYELLPNLDIWKEAGWIEDVRVDISPWVNENASLPHTVARLNLPIGRHRLVGILKSILDAPTADTAAFRPTKVPLSRVDLPIICTLAGELLRILEDIPRRLRLLKEAREKGQFDPATAPRSARRVIAGTPRDDLEAVREKLLRLLAPSVDDGTYQYKGSDADITGSGLDLEHIVTLKGLFWLCADPSKWANGIEDQREETMVQLVKWRRILDTEHMPTSDAPANVRRDVLPGARDRLHVDEIDSFALVRSVAPNAISQFLKDGVLDLPEEFIKRALEDILDVPFRRKDRPDELDDIYTANVVVGGLRLSTAFMLKGPGIGKKELTIAHCGKNGDQLVRLFDAPADLFVVQFVGWISEMVVKNVVSHVDALHKRGKKGQFMILDGQDTARLLVAYGKLGPS